MPRYAIFADGGIIISDDTGTHRRASRNAELMMMIADDLAYKFLDALSTS